MTPIPPSRVNVFVFVIATIPVTASLFAPSVAPPSARLVVASAPAEYVRLGSPSENVVPVSVRPEPAVYEPPLPPPGPGNNCAHAGDAASKAARARPRIWVKMRTSVSSKRAPL